MMWRNSRRTRVVLSTTASLLLRMSRIASGDVATTIGGINHFGPKLKRITAPPASRSWSIPV
jgi:hypothetical protein